MKDLKLGFLASHNGSNMQAIIDACKSGELKAYPALVISNNSRSGALERAKKERVPGMHISSKDYPDPDELDRAIVAALQDHGVNLVVLAGYMKKIGPLMLETYQNRILNIHPALLPKFGGQGMYGKLVHEAVLNAGESKSGASIHIVSGEYDQGPVLYQAEVPVKPDDTVDTLAARVLEVEHKAYVNTLQMILLGEIELP